jgi:hypothetical protein
MPIRLNLLAEAQALENQRRRDPLKRIILAGVLIMVGMFVWSSSIMFKTMVVKSEAERIQAELNSRTNDYRQVLENKAKLNDDNLKLVALQRLATNRFLVGNFLEAFQENTVDNVRLVHLKLDLDYTLVQESKPDKKSEGAPAVPAAPAKPAFSTEKVSFAINAKDSSLNPGDAVTRFRDLLASAPYFKTELGSQNEIRLKTVSAPQAEPGMRPYVLFALEANLPEKKR